MEQNDKDGIKKSLFEQHWIHARHIESERMWIMGIWLGVTGVMLKEVWMGENPSLNLQSLKSISIVHLIITVAVLSIIFKLQLEFTRYVESIRKIVINLLPQYENNLKGIWDLIGIPWGFNIPFKWFVTLGGVSALILIFGIVLDWHLITINSVTARFICGIKWDWFLILLGLIFAIYQFLYWIFEKRIKNRIIKINNDRSC